MLRTTFGIDERERDTEGAKHHVPGGQLPRSCRRSFLYIAHMQFTLLFSLFVPDYLLYARNHCIAFDAATVIGYQQKTVFNLSRLGAYNNSNNNGFNR